MRKPLSTALLLVLTLSAACWFERARPLELQVGQHRVSVLVPNGWEHVDFGDRHQFRRDSDSMMIEDLGRLSDDFDEAVEIGLLRLREDQQRDEASRRRFDLQGADAVVIETWDKLSHLYRKRFFFVKAGRPLLALYTRQGRFEAMAKPFDALVASFALVDSLPQTGLSGSPDQDPSE